MKTVYLVQVQSYLFKGGIAYDSVWQTIGVFSSKDNAEAVANKYDDATTTGHVIEIELNKEYDNL